MPMLMMSFPPVMHGYPYAYGTEVVCLLLREFGLLEPSIHSFWSDLVSYLQGRMRM